MVRFRVGDLAVAEHYDTLARVSPLIERECLQRRFSFGVGFNSFWTILRPGSMA